MLLARCPALPRWGRAGLVALLVLLSSLYLPAPATAYTDTVTRFTDGSSSQEVTLAYPPVATRAGSVELPSNATVLSASVRVSGAALRLGGTFTHNANVGFPNGTADAGLARSAGGLSLALKNGSTEYSGSALGGGTFSGTALVSGRVVLTGTSGTYTTPEVPWNGASYGRLIANVTFGLGGTAAYTVLSPSGALLQAGLRPGDLIAVDGRTAPSIRIRVDLSAPSAAESPAVERVGAGYVLADYLEPSAAYTVLSGVGSFRTSIELKESYFNFTEYPANPVLAGAAGTWYEKGLLLGSSVQVGREIWMYFHSMDGSDRNHVGRMVSKDGGRTWAVDQTPALNTTSGQWDSGYVGIPTVLPLPGGGFQMWYMGAVTVDHFAIGYATSADGVTWTKYASNPVLTKSTTGWDDYNVGWPNVIRVADTYYMFFSGRLSSDARKSIGFATSSDGINWAKNAGNPVIGWGTTTFGSYETAASEVVYNDGVFYLYWTCSSGATSYDTCVSTSGDAQSWSHFYMNPVLTHGDGVWDELTAELASRAEDPLSGHVTMLWTGRPSWIEYSLGRAAPKREGPGNSTSTWDLAGEIPHRFLNQALAVSLPANTSVGPSIAVSSDNVTFGPSESLEVDDSSIALRPARWLRHAVYFTSADGKASPALFSTRIAYERYLTAGSFVSPAVDEPYPIRNATVLLSGAAPTGTALALWVSNDGGATWLPAANNTLVVFPSPGASFRYKLAFNGTSALSPLVSSVSGTLGVESLPHDVVLRGDDGALLAQVAGELLAPRVVQLDPAYFNARLLDQGSEVPGVPVSFEFWANASSAGIIRLGALAIELALPDVLSVRFEPENPFVVRELNESVEFRAIASTTPGLPVTFDWWLDGASAGAGQPSLPFFAGVSTLGNHTVRVVVSNGQFTHARNWTLRVLDHPVFLRVVFYPAEHDLVVPAGALQQFFAAVANVTYPATINWTLDGEEAGHRMLYDYWAPQAGGIHLVRVEVTNGIDTFRWWWNITVVEGPSPPARQLSVSFAPGANVTLEVGQAQEFFANLSGAAPAGVVFEWRWDGGLQGAAGSAFAFEASEGAVGEHELSVLVRNETAIAAHLWTVVVVRPFPWVVIEAPQDGAVVDRPGIRVEGRASAGAVVEARGAVVNVSGNGTFAFEEELRPGANVIEVTARDVEGRVATARVTVRYLEPGGTVRASQAGGDFALVLVLAALVAAFVTLLVERRRRRRQQARPGRR